MRCSRRGATTASLQRPGSWPSSRQSTLQARRRKCGRWQWAVSRGGSSARQSLSRPPHISFAAWLGPHQVAVGVSASAEELAFGIRAVLEDRPDFAVWKLDLENAFNELSRALLLTRSALQKQKRRPLSGASCPLSAPSLFTRGAKRPPRHGCHVGRLCLGGRHTAGLPARAGTVLHVVLTPPRLAPRGALREKGDTGAEVVGPIMGDAAAIAPPHAIAAAQAELEGRLHLGGSTALQLKKCQWQVAAMPTAHARGEEGRTPKHTAST
jgi:hypothetical protein